jgi:DNA-directed RNA polymerase specialized sigma24 family protein
MTDNHQPGQTDPVDGLVLAARTDRTAFGRLFDEFYPLIFAYCMRRLLLRAVAEDVTSEVFLKVAGKRPKR